MLYCHSLNPFVGVGQSLDVDPNSNQVIVSGRMTQTGPHTVGRADPKTGDFKPIAKLSLDTGDVLGSASCYNSYTGVEYMQFAANDTLLSSIIRTRSAVQPSAATPITATTPNRVSIDLFGVDMASGKIDHIIQDSSLGHVLTTMQYDTRSKTLVGLGYIIVNGTFHRTVNRFDSVNGKWNVIADITADFLIESGGVSALDINGRILYAILQPPNVPQDSPFFLVGVNIDTGVIASKASLGAFENCPWSLEYQN